MDLERMRALMEKWHARPRLAIPRFDLQVELASPQQSAEKPVLLSVTPYALSARTPQGTPCSLRIRELHAEEGSVPVPAELGAALPLRLDARLKEGGPAAYYWELSVPSANHPLSFLSKGWFGVASTSTGKKETHVKGSMESETGVVETEVTIIRHSNDATQVGHTHTSRQEGYGPLPDRSVLRVPPNYVWVNEAGVYFATTAVSQQQWKKLMPTTLQDLAKDCDAADSKALLMWEQRPEMPMIGIRLDEAMEYCAELSKQENRRGRLPPGWVYRLPTPEEWWEAHEHAPPLPQHIWSASLLRLHGKSGPQPVLSEFRDSGPLHHLCGNTWE